MTTIPSAEVLPVPTRECTSCTAPTDRLDGLCSFCADPPPPLDVPGYGCSMGVPATLLLSAANHATMASEDVDDQLAELPAHTSMWLSVDLVRAQRHLRAATRLIEQVDARLAQPEAAR